MAVLGPIAPVTQRRDTDETDTACLATAYCCSIAFYRSSIERTAVGSLMVVALRGVLAAALAGSVFVQVVMVPLMAIDLKEADPDVAHLQIPFAVIMILVILTAQVTAVCVWRLVTMVREETVFSHDAFRYVDIMIGAAAAAAALAFALGIVLAPGDAVPRAWSCSSAGGPGGRGHRPHRTRSADAARPGDLSRGRGARTPGRARRGHLMPIVVDVDVMLAKRKMSVGELAQRGDHTGQPRRAQERPRQGRALHHARRSVRGPRVPAGRPLALGTGGQLSGARKRRRGAREAPFCCGRSVTQRRGSGCAIGPDARTDPLH